MTCPYAPSNGYKTINVFRDGPRYYVALIESQNGSRFVVKELLESTNSWAKDALSKEILFTNWIILSADTFLASHFLKNIDFDISEDSVWRVQPFCVGKFQNSEPSPFLLLESFSENISAIRLADFLSRLHKVTPSVPEKLISRMRSFTLKEYEKFINWEDLPTGLISDELKRSIRLFVDSETIVYNNAVRVLTHFEFYGSHIILREDKSLAIIDWENVGVSVESHDLVSIWLRSFQNKAWQDNLLNSFRSKVEDNYQFDKVFRVEVVLQSLGNIGYFLRSGDKNEIRTRDSAIRFFIEQVKNYIG